MPNRRLTEFSLLNYKKYSSMRVGIAVVPPSRAVIGGGSDFSNFVSSIDYYDMATLGNATNFGNLTIARNEFTACASTTRGCFMGGLTLNGGSYPPLNVIDYVTIASLGDAADFGDLTTTTRYFPAGFNSATRGIRVGGNNGSVLNVIDYITIATTGNATDFGDASSLWLIAGCSSPVRGVFGNGGLEYVTIATTGNSSSFGSLSYSANYIAAASNDTRGIWGGGDLTNSMSYITIATTGNGTDFGDLTLSRRVSTGASSAVRVTFNGGHNGSGPVNTIDYVTIATTGNATDFGDLTIVRQAPAATSSGNGGVL